MWQRFFTIPVFLLTIIVFSAQPLLAQETEDEELAKLLDLDIEELTISVASKRDEKISEAPGAVNIVTAQDIKRYGALNLRDVFSRIPSLQTYSSLLPNNTMSIRGQSNQHYPNRILFLINGRPFRESWSGGAAVSSLFLGMPVSAIEKIESIRGPGSVLYGSNAFSGVINIVTKQAVDDGMAEISTTYGSFGRKEFEGSGGYAGEDWSVYGAVKDSRSKGWTSSLTDEVGTSGSYKAYDDGNGYFVNAHYKDLSFNFFRGRTDEGNMGAAFFFPDENVAVG